MAFFGNISWKVPLTVTSDAAFTFYALPELSKKVKNSSKECVTGTQFKF